MSLQNAQNTTIHGGNLPSTIQGDVYIHPQAFGAKRKQKGT